MADPPKENTSRRDDACAPYYFPEISGSGENGCVAGPGRGNFVGSAIDRNGVSASAEAPPDSPEPMRRRIEEAFDKGLAQGRAEMAAAQQESVDQAAAALKAAAAELVRVRRQDVNEMETETVRLALAIAKKIVGSEAEQGTAVRYAVESALKKVADPRHLIVRLNPRDIDAVKSCVQDWLPVDDASAGLRIKADETIQRGGCLIETGLGDVDARIERQLRVVEDVLTAQLPRTMVEGP